jgi:cell division inhibitor SepF
MVDFCSGLTYALDGHIQSVASRVFLLTPRNVEVSAEERKRIAERAFFNQL